MMHIARRATHYSLEFGFISEGSTRHRGGYGGAPSMALALSPTSFSFAQVFGEARAREPGNVLPGRFEAVVSIVQRGGHPQIETFSNLWLNRFGPFKRGARTLSGLRP
jgi:hypothetical protein